MSKKNLGLIIPAQDEQIKKLSLIEIEQWLNTLKTADTITLIEQIIDKLELLNTMHLTPNERSAILELFQPLVKTNYELLKKRYVQQTQKLSEEKIKIIELSRKIHKSMLVGYKIIIENINIDNSSNLKTNLLPNIMYRAFKHFNKILDSYYQTYTQCEENIWREIHVIYQYASEAKINAATVTVDQNQYPIKLETLTPYKQALLIASMSPYEWRQQEQQVIYNHALLWTENVIIRDFKNSDLNNKTSIFFIPLKEDLGICSLYVKREFSSEQGSILDLTKLPQCLQNYSKNQTTINNFTNSNDLVLTKYAIEKLINNIQNAGKRTLERFDITGNVLLTFGFAATHYYLNNKRKFNPQNIDSENEEYTEQVELSATVTEETNENENSFQAEKALYKCNLINIHEEGARIEFQNATYPPIQPIEIIAMTIESDNQSESDPKRWNIGMVRWIKHNREGKLMSGIEILAPFAIPAAIQLMKNETTSGYFQRAFLVPNKQADQFNIITPTGKFESNRTVKIYSYQHKKFVETKLKEELISNNNFKCFTVDLKLPIN